MRTQFKISRLIILAALLFGLGQTASGQVVNLNQDYVLLEPQVIGMEGNQVRVGFGTYAENLFKQAFVVAVSLAVFMLVLSGISYIMSYVPDIKSQAKSMWTNAIWGLVIAILAYLLLYTINPQLVNFGFEIRRTPTTVDQWGNVGGSEGIGPRPNNPPNSGNNCNGCSNLSSYQNPPIPLKPGIGTSVVPELGDKLQGLTSDMPSDVNWRVTEAYPPSASVSHRNPCHYNGTCVDASLNVGGQDITAARINAFADAARANGLRPVYEVSNQSHHDRLVSEGVPDDLVIVVSGVSEHFSVYNE